MADLQLRSRSGMTRLERIKEAVRSYWLGPVMSSDPRAREFFGGAPTLTGISVNEYSAMSSSAVWSAVTMIADDIASLPLMLYKKLPNGGKDRFESHPLYRLLHDAPNPEMDTMVWRRTMQTHALLWQNAYAEIERDGAGRPIAMWPLIPERVEPFRQYGALKYRVTNPGGDDVFIPAEDMIHLVGQSHDGTVGSSLVMRARESLAVGLAAEKFGASFFGNGSTFGGVISFKGPKPPELSDKNYRESLDVRHQGVERAYKLLALYNDATYTRMGVPPNEGQFNETRVFQIREVARWFKMPPHKLGDLADATYSNVEQMDAAYMSSCVRPWLVLWQQQLSRKLIARSERLQQFIEHDTHGFLSVDAAGRAALYNAEFNVGSITPNEIRGYENRDPLDGGDRAFVPMNMYPLDRIDEIIDANLEAQKAKAEADRRPPPEPKPVTPAPTNGREIELLTEARDTARRCAQEAEDAKDIIAAELATVRAELAHRLAERDTVTAARAADAVEHERLIESLSLDITVARKDGQHAETRASDAQREIERLTAQATALGTDLATATADLARAVERGALIEADYQRVCQEKADLSALLVTGDAQRGVLEAECVSLGVRIDTLAGDVEAAQRETVAAVAQAAAVEVARTEALALAAETAHARDEAVATAARADAASAEWRQQAERLTAAALQIDAERSQERQAANERIAALEAEVQGLAELRTHADAVHAATVTDLRGQLTIAQDAYRAACEDVVLQQSEVATRDATIAALEADGRRLADARTHADEVNQATVTELRSQVDAVTQELTSTLAALLDAKTVIGTLEATRDSQRALLTAAEEASAGQSAVRQQLEARLSETRAAIRGTVVDAANRLIAKEADRARKQQGSPEKLGAWIGTFYPLHEDYCRMALKPAVRALMVAYGVSAPVDTMLDRIVASYLGESTRHLQGVIHDSEPETLAGNLERVLRRWESERAELLADRIIEGI